MVVELASSIIHRGGVPSEPTFPALPVDQLTLLNFPSREPVSGRRDRVTRRIMSVVYERPQTPWERQGGGTCSPDDPYNTWPDSYGGGGF